MMTAGTILVAIVAGLQFTPLHFLSKDATDFVCGMLGGLVLGLAVVWAAAR